MITKDGSSILMPTGEAVVISGIIFLLAIIFAIIFGLLGKGVGKAIKKDQEKINNEGTD